MHSERRIQVVSEKEIIRLHTPGCTSAEWKDSASIQRTILETYSALANSSGGTIIIEAAGGSEDGSICAPCIESFIEQLWEALNDPCKVSCNILRPRDVALRDMDGTAAIVITVPPAHREYKPVYLNGNMDLFTFKRNREGNRICSKSEVRSMLRDAFNDDQDNLPLPEADGCDWLVEDDLKRYISLLRSNSHLNGWAEQSSEDVLLMLGAASKKGGKLYPTRAGLLMFGKVPCILREFPEFRLDYREEVGGDRYTYRLNSDDIGSELNVFRFLCEVSSRLAMKIGVPFELEGMVRRSDSEALTAIREALVNTLLHADYRGSGGTTVVYDGRKVVFSNPGGMRIPLSKAKEGGISDPRNRTMMRMMLGIGLVEQMGSGVRSIFRAVGDGALLDASMSEEPDPLRTVTAITLAPAGARPDDAGAQVLRYVSEHRNATIKEISSEVGLSTRTVSRVIKELIESGSLRREGNNRRSIWTVIV